MLVGNFIKKYEKAVGQPNRKVLKENKKVKRNRKRLTESKRLIEYEDSATDRAIKLYKDFDRKLTRYIEDKLMDLEGIEFDAHTIQHAVPGYDREWCLEQYYPGSRLDDVRNSYAHVLAGDLLENFFDYQREKGLIESKNFHIPLKKRLVESSESTDDEMYEDLKTRITEYIEDTLTDLEGIEFDCNTMEDKVPGYNGEWCTDTDWSFPDSYHQMIRKSYAEELANDLLVNFYEYVG